jgi:hypothetical protein
VGSANNDTITGSTGADNLDAGLGDDTINGFVGADTVNGNTGADTLVLTATSTDLNAATNAQLVGLETVTAATAAAAVLLNLGNQNDGFTIVGSANNDTITGSTGADNLDAGLGDDTINGFVGADTVNGNTGADTLVLTATSADLNAATNAQLVGLETVTAATAAAAVLLNLGNQDDGFTIVGSANNDTITGSTGNDVVTGGLGSDTIDAGNGTNSVTDAGQGADTVIHGGTGTVVVAVTGTGTVTLTASTAGATTNSAAGVNTTVNASTSTFGVTLNGNTGADTLVAGSGNDTLVGGNGDDVFRFLSVDFTNLDNVAGGNNGDTIEITDNATIVGADFTNVSSVETLLLSGTGASVVTLYDNDFAYNAGIRNVVVSSGNDVVHTFDVDAHRGDLTVNLAAGGTDTLLLRNEGIGNNGASAIVGGLGGNITTNATSFTYVDNSAVVTVTSASHGLISGDIVRFGSTFNPGDVSISAGTDYVVTVDTANTFRITATSDGDPDTAGTFNSTISMTRSNGATLNNTIARWDAAGQNEGVDAVTINGFAAGNGGDRIAYLLGNTATVIGGFADNVNLNTNNLSGLAPNSVIEIQSNFQINDGTNLGAVATMLDQLNGVQDGTYYIVIYDGTSANSNAYIYVATATEGDGFDFADTNGATNGYDTDTLELLGVLNSVGADLLTSQNFISSFAVPG